MSAPELVCVRDFNPGDVVSFDEDPERWTVDDVWPDDLPEHRSVLFVGAACPSPLPVDYQAVRWHAEPRPDSDAEGYWMEVP